MKFLKMEWTKKRGAIALLATAMVVTSFILGGYVATGSWNPWGNRHYYQILNANFQECYTPVGGTTQCQTGHNVIFNTGALYVEQLVTRNNEGFCAVSATCSFNFIAMSNTATAPVATMSSTGLTTTTSSGDCGVAGGTGVGGQNGAELTTNGFAAAAATSVTDITGSSPQTSSVVKTFTATATQQVQQSCLVNQAANAAATRVNLAAQTFTAITLNNLDTIQITWSITWTWS